MNSSSSQQHLRDFDNQQQPCNAQNLSLSLSFHQYATHLNLRNAIFKNSVPLGPFTGYSSILKRSRFLKPTQQILDEFCGVKCQSIDLGLHDFCESGAVRETVACSDHIMEHRWKNSKLILMLDEIYRRYKLYCQQMQSVVASFETVPGLGNAAPYISFAVRTIAKHFTCLKNAIMDQIQLTGKISGDGVAAKGDISRLCSIDQGLHSQKSAQNLSFLHPIWRSQRGLPDHAVAMLKKWLFEHFLHPYPTDSEKQMLAQQTGLSRTQVSNWFINARVRVWKPMVEEIHTLETRQAQTTSEAVRQDASVPSNNLPLTKSLPAEKSVEATFRQKVEASQPKRPRNDMIPITEHNEAHRNACFGVLSGNQQLGITGSSSVSLALGLHNNGIRFLQPFSMNTAQHTNVETDGVVNSTAGFEAGNQRLR